MALGRPSRANGLPVWDLRAATLLILVQVGGQLIFVLIALPIVTAVAGRPLLGPDSQPGSQADIVIGGAAYLFASATAMELVRFLSYRRGFPSFKSAVALDSSRLWTLGIPLAVVLALLLDGTSLLLGKPIVPPEFRPVFSNVLSGSAYALFSVVVPPFVEEVIFRGVLFSAAEHRYGRYAAILVSASLFGLVHSLTYGLDWYPIMQATVTGLLLGVLRSYSGSLWPSITAHATNNLYASLEALLLPKLLGYFP